MQFDKRQYPIYLLFQMVRCKKGSLFFSTKPHNALLMKKPSQIQSLHSQTLIVVFDSLHSSFDEFEPYLFSLVNLTFSIVNCSNSRQVLGFAHFRPTNWRMTLLAIQRFKKAHLNKRMVAIVIGKLNQWWCPSQLPLIPITHARHILVVSKFFIRTGRQFMGETPC